MISSVSNVNFRGDAAPVNAQDLINSPGKFTTQAPKTDAPADSFEKGNRRVSPMFISMAIANMPGGGVRRGFEGGQTPLYRRLPKRGFTNIHAKTYTEVTFKMLNKSKATDVTAETLLEEGIIGKINDGIVILATGKLDKKLNVKAKRFTAKAKEEIEALGGKVEVI